MTFDKRDGWHDKVIRLAALCVLISAGSVLSAWLISGVGIDHKGLLLAAVALCGLITLIWQRQPRRWAVGIVIVLGALLRFLPMARYPDEVLGLSGLFGTFIDTIAACFPCQPTTIPYYSPEPLPFAYPPLAFHLFGIAKLITGAETTTLMKIGSPLFSALTIPVFYAAAGRVTARWREQISALAIYAFTPTAYYAHVAGAGFPRSMAYLWLLVGLYASLRLAGEKQLRWVGLLGVALGLTILTHPLVVVVFGLMVIGVYVGRDLSRRGFGLFALSGAIGIVIAAPYLIAVVAAHGIAPYVNALNASSGGMADRLFEVATLQIDASPFIALWTVFAIIGALYSVASREWLMLILFGLLALTPQTPDLFLIIPVAFLAAMALNRVVIPVLQSAWRTHWKMKSEGWLAGGVLVVLLAAGFGQGFFNSWTHLVPIVDQGEAAAMIEARNVMSEDAILLGVGTETEWLGYYVHRQVANAYWGSEWIDAPTARWYGDLMGCAEAKCVAGIADEAGARYLFVPIRANGASSDRIGLLLSELDKSAKFHKIFINEAAVVYSIDVKSP